MKKLIWVLVPILVIALAGYFGFDYLSYFTNPILKELPIYRSKEIYSYGFWQDYTDYGKYFYKNVSEEDMESAESFKKVTKEDAEEIFKYIDGYESFINNFGSDGIESIKEVFDFDKSVIDTGDYYYISNGNSYTFFCMYYFDTDSQILYYFYNDI